MASRSKGVRRKERRRKEKAGRELRRAYRSNIALVVVATIVMLAFLLCTFGYAAPWCLGQPWLFIVTIGASSVAGLALGGTIRSIRELRSLRRDVDE